MNIRKSTLQDLPQILNLYKIAREFMKNNGSDREPYGVIHRVASNGVTKGVTRAAFSYGLERSGYVRIDTHEDNKPMQGALKKFGFRECGVIHLERGAERIAFDCRKEWL